MLPKATGRGQHFEALGHSFSLYAPILSRKITCLIFSFFTQLFHGIGLRAVYKPNAKKIYRAGERATNSDTRQRKMY